VLRIVLITAAVASLLVLAKRERVLERTGIVGTCTELATPAPPGSKWWSCKSGEIADMPDLWRDWCTQGERRGDVQFWLCPASVTAALKEKD
jgi:hypothetical protein